MRGIVTNSYRTVFAAGAVAAAAFGLIGCSEGGTATPGPTTTASSPVSSSAPPVSTSAASGDPIASLDVCGLLGSADLDREFAQFAPFNGGAPSDSGTLRGCSWENETDTASDPRLSIDVVVRPEQGVKDAQDAGGGVQTGELASGRQAARIPIPSTKSCIMALAVTPTSRVDVTVIHEQACDMASAVADLVDPKLPKG